MLQRLVDEAARVGPQALQDISLHTLFMGNDIIDVAEEDGPDLVVGEDNTFDSALLLGAQVVDGDLAARVIEALAEQQASLEYPEHDVDLDDHFPSPAEIAGLPWRASCDRVSGINDFTFDPNDVIIDAAASVEVPRVLDLAPPQED